MEGVEEKVENLQIMENTNKAIAVNSIILYGRMIVTVLCSVLTTRFALQALGINDFGLYSLLGGIISFVSIFNTIMLSTSNRFIAVAIGKGDEKEINAQFNVSLVIHVCIAVLTFLIAFPVGDWYISNYVNYDGDISKALMVFNISIAASILSFIGVPFNGLLLAKEKFIVFCGADVIVHLGKLLVAYWLISFGEDKLLIYTIALAIFTVFPVLLYIVYCSGHFYKIIKFKIVKEKKMYKEMFIFSLWVSIGAIAMIGKNQGAAMIVNAFFNTVMNTAMGVANSISSYIVMFSHNVTQPMSPQITKSYAANDTKRTDELLLMSTKYAFFLMLLASSPFLLQPEWILNIWLGQVPPYATTFLVLMIVDNLVLSLNVGISNVIFASGKIRLYQIITSALNILSVVLGFIPLYAGLPAYSLYIVYIFMSILRVIAIQIILKVTLKYENSIILRNSYLPSLLVVVSFLPMLLIKDIMHPVLLIILAMVYLTSMIFFIGLKRNERKIIVSKVMNYVKRLS